MGYPSGASVVDSNHLTYTECLADHEKKRLALVAMEIEAYLPMSLCSKSFKEEVELSQNEFNPTPKPAVMVAPESEVSTIIYPYMFLLPDECSSWK